MKNAFSSTRTLGIPENVRKWTADFMTNTTIVLRRGQVVGSKRVIPEGLPQGSPLSPVLFAMLMSDIGRAWPNSVKIFADDILVMDERVNGSAPIPAEQTGNEIVDRLWSKGLNTDTEKYELLFLSKKEKATLHIKEQATESKPSIKYLGCTFDRKLTFLPHIADRATKATATVGRISRLISATGGLSPKTIRSGIQCMVLPSLTYGSEAWYKNSTFGVGSALVPINVSINRLLRKGLRLKKTTSIKAIWWEIGLTPIPDFLEEKGDRWTLNFEYMGRKSILPEMMLNAKVTDS